MGRLAIPALFLHYSYPPDQHRQNHFTSVQTGPAWRSWVSIRAFVAVQPIVKETTRKTVDLLQASAAQKIDCATET